MKKLILSSLLLNSFVYANSNDSKFSRLQENNKKLNIFLQAAFDAAFSSGTDNIEEIKRNFVTRFSENQQKQTLQELKDSENLLELLMLISYSNIDPQPACSIVEKMLDDYNRTIQDTSSLTLSYEYPVNARVTIDGQQVDSLEKVHFTLQFDKLLALCKECQKANHANS